MYNPMAAVYMYQILDVGDICHILAAGYTYTILADGCMYNIRA